MIKHTTWSFEQNDAPRLITRASSERTSLVDMLTHRINAVNRTNHTSHPRRIDKHVLAVKREKQSRSEASAALSSEMQSLQATPAARSTPVNCAPPAVIYASVFHLDNPPRTKLTDSAR